MALSKQKYFELVGYKPHPKQRLFHASGARFRVPVCGRRFGKSHMAGRDAGAELFLPKRRYWIVGPTYDLAEKEFRVIWDDLIVGQKLGRDKRVKRAYSRRSGEMWIEFPWQTRVECRSADHPENLVGEKLHGAIMSEAAKHRKDTFERFIRPALADERGWATFPTTPEGYNWLYDLWTLGRKGGEFASLYESWQFPSWENPYVYPLGREDPEIKLIKATVLPAFFDQEIAALFNAFVGKIYEEFSEIIHTKQFTYNPAWPNYMCFDWGFTNPLAAIEFQVDPWGRVWVWREHYKANMMLPAHIAEIKARPQPPGYKIDLAFGDAADPGAIVYVSTCLAPCIGDPRSKSGLEKKGTRESGWREGIDLVKSYLQLKQIGELDEYGTPLEEPWLYVSTTCTNTIREFNNYRAPTALGRLGQERNVREDAQKFDDHALDALRYGMMHVFKLGVTDRLSDFYSRDELEEVNESMFEEGRSGFFSVEALSQF
jgi:terminase large subunit-like protein